MIDREINFNPFFAFKNPHFQTILPKIVDFDSINYNRIRLATVDNDFLDIDTILSNHNTAIILIHGLEGSSQSHYIKRIAKKIKSENDIFVLNLRGCSGVDNTNLYAYHSGKTEDLATLITYISIYYAYNSLAIIGYSLGANLALKYIGEQANSLPKIIKKCISVSAPIDLNLSADIIDSKKNTFYKRRFLKALLSKVNRKKSKFASHFDFVNSKNITSIRDFDDWYTAKVNGYENATDYYKKKFSTFIFR